ncbi:hypothetical protein [Halobacteriovorax marinus]|uniref:hypothetical protein n=1 Tax=Halobacteriovorax marinus TaxID=97084 RepID=UPI003A925B1A
MSLLGTIEEQTTFGFTGRVNILNRSTGQYLGIVLIADGVIVDCTYGGLKAEKALYLALFDDMDHTPLKFIVEPEVVQEEHRNFQLTFEDFKQNSQTLYLKHRESKALKPSMDLRLILDGDFISRGSEVSDSEFKLMNVLTEYSLVSDIYNNCDLYDFEITQVLVSLRKKKAIKVVK